MKQVDHIKGARGGRVSLEDNIGMKFYLISKRARVFNFYRRTVSV